MYTPSKIKISMLCALALCGQVRRDDLAIFARTADAGVRMIRELEDRGLIEDKTVEATVRSDENSLYYWLKMYDEFAERV